MSYDFAIWEGGAPTGGPNAAATFKVLFSHYLDADLIAPTESIQAYSEALAAHFPGDESEDTPWSAGGPIGNGSGPILYVAVRYSHAEQVGVVAERLAQEHGLVFFDPQTAPTGDVTIKTSRGQAAIPERWVLFLSQELRDVDDFVIVESGRDDYFAQARNHDGSYFLEYRDGSPQQHYQVQGVDLGDVTEALSQWSEHRRDFIPNHTWQRLTLWDPTDE